MKADLKARAACALDLCDEVLQHANPVDLNADHIGAGQRKVISRHDARSGHQENSVGKAIVAEEELRQLARFALEFGERGAPGEDRLAGAFNHQLDGGRLAKWHSREKDAGAKRATAVVDLCLRQI